MADVVDSYQTNFKGTVTFKFQAGDTIDIDNSTELGKFVTDIGTSALTLVDQAVTVSGTTLSVTQARSIAADTTGTVTASINTASRVSDLTTLYNPGTGVNETNAWTIVISSADKTSSAADLNTINASTSAEVNAAEVTGISSSAIADVGTLMTNAVKDGDPDAREFTAGSFVNLAAVTLSDATIAVGDLNTAISNANTVASGAVTKFTVSNGAALINAGDEAAFTTLMSKEGAAGTDNINLTTQALTVTGTIGSITNANNFTASTTGTVTGTIAVSYTHLTLPTKRIV